MLPREILKEALSEVKKKKTTQTNWLSTESKYNCSDVFIKYSVNKYCGPKLIQYILEQYQNLLQRNSYPKVERSKAVFVGDIDAGFPLQQQWHGIDMSSCYSQHQRSSADNTEEKSREETDRKAEVLSTKRK